MIDVYISWKYLCLILHVACYAFCMHLAISSDVFLIFFYAHMF